MWNTTIITDYLYDPQHQTKLQISAVVAIALCVAITLGNGFKFWPRFFVWSVLKLVCFVVNTTVLGLFVGIDVLIYTYELSTEETLLLYLSAHVYFALWRCLKYRKWELIVFELWIFFILGGLLVACMHADEGVKKQWYTWLKNELCQYVGAFSSECSLWFDHAIGFGMYKWKTQWINDCLNKLWWFEINVAGLFYVYTAMEDFLGFVVSVIRFCLSIWLRK